MWLNRLTEPSVIQTDMNGTKLHLTAVAGGIGSGKSVVCRILAAMGYEVYDCDSRAKAIMDASEEIISGIEAEICAGAIVTDSCGRRAIDRKALSAAVFADAELLQRLNRLVHEAVKRDIALWAGRLSASEDYREDVAFVETAILYESGLHAMVDDVWEVTAPDSVRLERAMKRDHATRQQILARMESQRTTSAQARERISDRSLIPPCHTICNDGQQALLPQILALLQ